MRVLLVSANREDFPDPVYPLGISLVAAAVERAGHAVRLLDLRWDAGELATSVEAWRPDVVGLGIRNVDNLTWGRSVSYLPEIEAAVAELRTAFQGPLILGGSGYSLFPAALLRRLGADWGVVGEGEEAFPSLLDTLSRGADLAPVPGVVCRETGDRPATPRATAPLMRHPLRQDLLAHYLPTGAAVGVQAKRGCAFACTYCTYPALEGRTLRLREPDDVVDEVEELAGAGARSVFFVDDTFNIPADHAEGICRRLVERGVRVSWSAFVHPGRLAPELAEWMRRSGCAGLEFGTDSLSDPVLEALQKGFTAAEVTASAAAAAGAGIPAAHYLLLGSPGETPATLAQTLEAGDRLPPAAFIALVGVRLYPGTELVARARAEGLCGGDDSLLEPTFYLSPGMSAGEVARAVGRHARSRRAWVVPGLGIRSDPAVLDRLRRTQRSPTWAALLVTRSADEGG
ncbi:MAG: lipid biosynthesis B12-binding/radical SAM protein [Thermodesulfobacteriota bacterium]